MDVFIVVISILLAVAVFAAVVWKAATFFARVSALKKKGIFEEQKKMEQNKIQEDSGR